MRDILEGSHNLARFKKCEIFATLSWNRDKNPRFNTDWESLLCWSMLWLLKALQVSDTSFVRCKAIFLDFSLHLTTMICFILGLNSVNAHWSLMAFQLKYFHNLNKYIKIDKVTLKMIILRKMLKCSACVQCYL